MSNAPPRAPESAPLHLGFVRAMAEHGADAALKRHGLAQWHGWLMAAHDIADDICTRAGIELMAQDYNFIASLVDAITHAIQDKLARYSSGGLTVNEADDYTRDSVLAAYLETEAHKPGYRAKWEAISTSPVAKRREVIKLSLLGAQVPGIARTVTMTEAEVMALLAAFGAFCQRSHP